MKTLILITGLPLALAGNAALAQDTGAFSMGQLTGTLSQDHITQSEEARSQSTGDDEASSRSNRAIRNCASVPALRARFGAKDPRIGTLVKLCRQLGYPTQ